MWSSDLLLLILQEKKGEKAMETVRYCLEQKSYQEALEQLDSPLEPSYKLAKLR